MIRILLADDHTLVRRGVRLILEQEPDLSAFPDVMAYVQAGLGPADDPYRARYLLELAGHDVRLETNTAMPAAFLMAQMELREAVAEAKDGKELWRVGGFNPDQDKYFRSISSPVAANGIILAPYSRGTTLTAISLEGKQLWRKAEISADVPTPAAADDRAYVCNDQGRVACVALKTGEMTLLFCCWLLLRSTPSLTTARPGTAELSWTPSGTEYHAAAA